jgi:RNA polymerase sigma-70 factor, ECF subfamily
VRACLRRNAPGPYQLQAAIAAVHTDAATSDATDWGQIVALYDHLHALQPTDVVALNRAIAIAERDGAQAGLNALDTIQLDGYHHYHAARAELLARLERVHDALAAYDRAIALTANETERRFLVTRRAAVDTPRR